jgi:xanthine dehydrogenase/oxidase
VLDRAVLHCDGTSFIPAVRIAGKLCKTNIPSNTAFRGFGGPQGMLVANMWMDHVARELGLAFEKVQERNLYAEGQQTHFGQLPEWDRLHKCWHGALEMAAFAERRAAVDAFNKTSRCGGDAPDAVFKVLA